MSGNELRHNAPAMEVEHYRLDPADRLSNKWASACPVCGDGMLMVRRDPQSRVLQDIDNCLLCGQVVIYADIAQMRANDAVTG